MGRPVESRSLSTKGLARAVRLRSGNGIQNDGSILISYLSHSWSLREIKPSDEHQLIELRIGGGNDYIHYEVNIKISQKR